LYACAIARDDPGCRASNWVALRHRTGLERGTLTTGHASNTGGDDDERQALRAEGLDPDDPTVIAAIRLVRWELSLAGDDRGICGDYAPEQID
jgi:hypothetical protein